MTLTDHLRAPGIPINDHIVYRASQLSASLKQKIAIYLDTRFWIMVREVRDGTSTRTDEREIGRLLEAIVSAGIGFCPIAEPTFSELMKQGDTTRRKATADAVDSLSAGVTLLPHDVRMVAEAESVLLSRLSGAGSPVFNAWTGLSYVLGNLFPVATPFPAETERTIQRAFYDRLWERPLVEIAVAIDQMAYARASDLAASALRLSEANRRHADEMISFDLVREGEFHGLAEFIAQHIERLSSLSADLQAMGSNPTTILSNAIRELLKYPEQARYMPTAHVDASLHALFRWEYRDRALTANDLLDFRHAAAALGHCDIMLTEAALRKALCHKRIKLDAVHHCTVLSDRSDVIHRLEQVLDRH